MKVGASKIGYTSGALYKRHKHINYTPGSKYDRFGKFGLLNQRNLSSMNRQALESYRSAVSDAGPTVFGAMYSESVGHSELAANQVLKRVQEAMNALADQSESLSLANGGTGGAADTTGSNVDETV